MRQTAFIAKHAINSTVRVFLPCSIPPRETESGKAGNERNFSTTHEAPLWNAQRVLMRLSQRD